MRKLYPDRDGAGKITGYSVARQPFDKNREIIDDTDPEVVALS